jgi:[ribosomal protein S5]-alanine N-acetyltransferase
MLDPNAGAGWPVELTDGPITLRPLGRRDGRTWNSVRSNNAAWLAPWEATRPEGSGRPLTFASMVRSFDREARAGRMLPLVIDIGGRLAGQVTVSAIVWGSLRSGQIGYWIDRAHAGRGVVPNCVAMMVDHCFFGLGMHRLEVNIRPENEASLRVVEKLGFRPEGIRRKYLHIDGEWRDHATFALTPEDVPGGLLTRWRRAQRVLSAHDRTDDPGLHQSSHVGQNFSGLRSRSVDDTLWSLQSPVTPVRHTADGP